MTISVREAARFFKDDLYVHFGKKFNTYAIVFPIDKDHLKQLNGFGVRVIFKTIVIESDENPITLWDAIDRKTEYINDGYLEMEAHTPKGGQYFKKFKFREGEYFAIFVGDQDGGAVMNEKFLHDNFEKVE